jgi:hypothetical protein
VVKPVVASGVDEEGEQHFPCKWNAEFIDLLPSVAALLKEFINS